MHGVTGILLAAGSSLRFGRDKQATLIDGQPLLVRAARVLLDAGFQSPIVVLGPQAAQHRALLAGLPLRIIENPSAATGMAGSLHTALKQANASDAIVVTVCDQPAVTAAHLAAIVRRWRLGGCSLVASTYTGTQGVPALFATQHYPEIEQLEGDRGAGPLLARHADSLALLPLPGGALDLDTPEDLARYQRERLAQS